MRILALVAGCTGTIDGSGDTDTPEAEPELYAGGWAKGDCDDITATGYEPGQVAPDFALMDQHGEMVHLHDFCDRTVLLQIGAFWCGPCMEEAQHLEELYQEHKDQGLFPMTVSAYGMSGDTAVLEDLQDWAQTYGLTTPVLADPGFDATIDYMAQGNGLPHRVLIDPGLVVRFIGVYSDEEIVEALEQGPQ